MTAGGGGINYQGRRLNRDDFRKLVLEKIAGEQAPELDKKLQDLGPHDLQTFASNVEEAEKSGQKLDLMALVPEAHEEDQKHKQMIVLKGIGGGTYNIGFGGVYVLDEPETSVRKVRIPEDEIEKEVEKIEALRKDFNARTTPTNAGAQSKLILEALKNARDGVLKMAVDIVRGEPEVIQKARDVEEKLGSLGEHTVLSNIVTDDGHMCADWAVEHAGEIYASEMQYNVLHAKKHSPENASHIKRWTDLREQVKYAAKEAWQALMGVTVEDRAKAFMDGLQEPTVFVGREMSPTLGATVIARDGRRLTKGIAIETGGVLSHLFIVGRDNNISVIVNASGIAGLVETGTKIVVDDFTGDVVLNPTPDVEKYFRLKQRWYAGIANTLLPYREIVAKTKDEEARVKFGANIATPEQAKLAAENGADGIRLFRTEYLYHLLGEREVLEEGFYERLYRRRVEDYHLAIDLYENNHCTPEFKYSRFYTRVPDFRRDKPHHAILPLIEGKEELLKDGGIRLLLEAKDPKTGRPELLTTEIMAILAVSKRHEQSILLPMVRNANDVVEVKKAVEEAKRRLDKMGVEYDPDTPISTMFETKESIGNAGEIFDAGVYSGSIGTNDLKQGLLGIQREEFKHRSHPALIREITDLREAAAEREKELTLCGEMASDDTAIEACIGVGVRRFSVGPSLLPHMKKLVSLTTLPRCEFIGANAGNFRTAAEFEGFVTEKSDALREMEKEFTGIMPTGFIPKEFKATDLKTLSS